MSTISPVVGQNIVSHIKTIYINIVGLLFHYHQFYRRRLHHRIQNRLAKTRINNFFFYYNNNVDGGGKVEKQ